jgi:hypothetical protein
MTYVDTPVTRGMIEGLCGKINEKTKNIIESRSDLDIYDERCEGNTLGRFWSYKE